MKFYIFLLVLLIVPILASSDLKTLTHNEAQTLFDATKVLLKQSIMMTRDEALLIYHKYCNSDDLTDVQIIDCHQLAFNRIISIARYDAKIAPVKPSIFDQVYNLMTFANIMLMLSALATFVFILSFTWWIILYGVMIFGSMVSVPLVWFYENILTYLVRWEVAYALGLTFAGLLCLPDPTTMWDTCLGYLYLFEHHSVFLGALFYMATVGHICWMNNVAKKTNSAGIVFIIYFLGLAPIAFYQNHSFVATMSIWSLYGAFGFCMGSFPGGYYTGFNDSNAILRCYILSLVMVAGFLISKCTGNYYDQVQVFETGALFWGTFNGLLAMLIMSDKNYMYYRKIYSPEMFMFMQMFMLASCLLTMYFGTVLSITQMMGIGGTFLVLWMLDLEYLILSNLGSGSLVGSSFVCMVTLYGLYYYMTHFPQYFIFG